MTSSLLKSADLSHFFEKYVMWRYLTSTFQIFIKLSESAYFHEISILCKFQVNPIIFDKVMAICRICPYFQYFAYFRLLRHVGGHISLKNDRIDSKFAQVQDFRNVNIFWDFCENPTLRRHVPSPDVICRP